MKTRLLSNLAAALLVAAAPLATAGSNEIPVHGRATVGASQVILDLFADSPDVPLRGFGVKVWFDVDRLSLQSGGRYDGLWFLRGENGARFAYTDLTVPEAGCVRVIGGRLDGSDPATGVAGNNLLLATLVFGRLTADEPKFELGLASPKPYVSFASAEGEPLDELVTFENEVPSRPADVDSDKDGLPDRVEMDLFGDLTTSDGASDTDGDGEDDLSEWIAGTDLRDPGSKFVLRILPQPDGSKLVFWNGKTGRVYDLEYSRDPGRFDILAAGLPGAEAVFELLDDLHRADPEGFYRVRTKFPTLGR